MDIQADSTDAAAAIRWRPLVGWWAAHSALVLLAIFVPYPPTHGSGLHVGQALARWGTWQDDAVNYAHIAFHGYGASPAYPAYWPGIPLLIAVTRSPWITLAVVEAALLAVMRLMAAVAIDLGLSAPAALLAVALFALNPAAVYYSSAYPEVWVVGGFLLAIWSARHRRAWPMAVGTAVATIMDPLGAVVGLLPLLVAVRAWRRRDPAGVRVGLAGVAAGGLTIVGYGAYLAAAVGSPLAMVAAQRYWLGAWTVPGVQIVQEARLLLLGVSQTNRGAALIALLLIILPALYSGVRWLLATGRPLEMQVAVAAGVMALFSLAFQAERLPLLSTARFLSMGLAVPGYFGMARWSFGVRPLMVLAGLIALLGGIAFTHGYFWW